LPLHAALRNGAGLAAVKIIFEGFQAAIYHPDRKGRLPLHRAASHSTPDVVNFLLTAIGNNGTAENRTRGDPQNGQVGGDLPLHLAAARRTPSKKIAELLIQAWPEAIHEKNGYEQTPLQVAQKAGVEDPEVLNLLANGMPN
jgi:hypothetical protein